MPLDQTEVITDLTKAYAFYMKVKAAVASPATLAVVPPIKADDKADEALGIAQALSPDFISFIRQVSADVKS